MPKVNPECYHESSSSVIAFKDCPTLYRLKYREGLRPAVDTDSQRIGTNWHEMHETYANAINSCEHPGGNAPLDPKDYALTAVVSLLNTRYEQMPASKTSFEWGLERQVLLTCFIGYLWYYQDDPIETLASEIPFELPLHEPRTGLPLLMREVVRVGKIDHLIMWQGMIGVQERKSTTRSIDHDSDYWDKAKKDTQVSMYALAFRDMMAAGCVPPDIATRIAMSGRQGRVGSTLYDVWRRPTIKPAKLTQAETEAFLNSGTYCGQTFRTTYSTDSEGKLASVKVDDEEAEFEVGKSGKPAIRETIGMFGARLLADIYERPEHYYVRREIARTDQEIRKFRVELYNIYQAKRIFARTGCWYENERQCRATRACDMIPICYGPGADAVCDGVTVPPGFVRIFADPKQKEIVADE